MRCAEGFCKRSGGGQGPPCRAGIRAFGAFGTSPSPHVSYSALELGKKVRFRMYPLLNKSFKEVPSAMYHCEDFYPFRTYFINQPV